MPKARQFLFPVFERNSVDNDYLYHLFPSHNTADHLRYFPLTAPAVTSFPIKQIALLCLLVGPSQITWHFNFRISKRNPTRISLKSHSDLTSEEITVSNDNLCNHILNRAQSDISMLWRFLTDSFSFRTVVSL